MDKKPKIAYFGGEPLSVPVLEELKIAGLLPELIICSPDRKAHRGQKLTPPPVKEWALENNLEVFQPDSYSEKEDLKNLTEPDWDLFVVVAYNFILPKWLIELPKYGTLNVHPSLLPKLRGPSPIRTAILENKRDEVGISIMLMDEKMDHGPILAKEAYVLEDWPIPGNILDGTLAAAGGKLLSKTILEWIRDDINPEEQDHSKATYTKKFIKGDNELSIDPLNLPSGEAAHGLIRKIYAWTGIGDTFFIHNDERIKVKAACISEDDQLKILRVTPAGKSEMAYADFLRNL